MIFTIISYKFNTLIDYLDIIVLLEKLQFIIDMYLKIDRSI